MGPIHHFHLDVRGHSVTVNLDCGRHGTAELLIDGKETGRAEVHGTRALLLRGELPTDPPVPVRVDITLGPGAPRCVAFVDGSPTLMPARPF